MSEATEIVRITLKDGTTVDQLKEIRGRMETEFSQEYGGRFRAQLYALEDGSFVDVWTWESREIAEAALADPSDTPSFIEWAERVEIVGFDWATPEAWGRHGK